MCLVFDKSARVDHLDDEAAVAAVLEHEKTAMQTESVQDRDGQRVKN